MGTANRLSETMEIILYALLIPTDHAMAINIKEALVLHGNKLKPVNFN